MKWLLLVLFSGTASAACQNLYNPMSGQWEYVCTPDPSEPQLPQCRLHYDPFNDRWVEVCE